MKKILISLFIVIGYIKTYSQTENNMNVVGRWNSYNQHKWLTISSTGFTADNFYLDSKDNIDYRVDRRIAEAEENSNKQKKYLIQAKGYYKLDILNKLIYLCFTDFHYSDSTTIKINIQTVAKVIAYKKHSDYAFEQTIAHNVNIVLHIPMNDSYIPEDISKNNSLSATNDRLISEEDFYKIQSIEWDINKTEIIEKIDKSNFIELLKLGIN